MRSKQLSMAEKLAIIDLKNEKKSIRDIAETLGISKSTVWNIIKKQERTGGIKNGKSSGRPRKTTVVDDETILSIVQKKPFSTAEQIRSTLQDAGVAVSKTTIRRRLHQHNFRWHTATCKTQDNSTQDKSGLSLLQEDVRREILQKMQTRFSSIADSETLDLEELLSIAQQELALAAATSSHVNIPEELVSNLQELICKLCQARQPDAEEPAHSSENITDTSDDSPSSK